VRAALALALAGCGGSLLSPGTPIDRVAYPNGKARFEFELRGGIPNGRGRAWHANGKLASDGTYHDGARDGRFWFYSEDGTFASQAVFVDNTEVWRSFDEAVRPPEASMRGVAFEARPSTAEATFVDTGPDVPFEVARVAPRAYFSTLDRTTSPARTGAQLGVGDAKDLGFGAATRLDVFGHYRFGHYGAFAQLSETRLALQHDMTLGGRRAVIVAGTYHHALGPAMLSANGGFIASLGNTDAAGSIASYAGAQQRPSDAAIAVPAPFGLRSGASITTGLGPFVTQADAGIDWLLGGDDQGFDPLGRANIGVGFGSRSTMLTAELDNAIHLSGSGSDFHAVALGGTIAFSAVWISASLAFSFASTTSVLASVGYDL
jgi:hypothetical protein